MVELLSGLVVLGLVSQVSHLFQMLKMVELLCTRVHHICRWIKVLTIQGDPKKMSLSVFELKSVLDVGFDFSACGLESES